MTIEQIRKNIHVAGYGIHDNGLRVVYDWFENREDAAEGRELILLKNDALKELNSIGEINYWGDALLEYNGKLMPWNEFADTWTFSQWDALTLVIRHEYNKVVEQEIENGDIGKAINNLLKK